jgi:hypothetical protein
LYTVIRHVSDGASSESWNFWNFHVLVNSKLPLKSRQWISLDLLVRSSFNDL